MRVRNAGTAAVQGISGLAVYTDHVPIGCSDPAWANTGQIPALAVGATADVVVFTYGFPTQGSHTVHAFTDFSCLYEELD